MKIISYNIGLKIDNSLKVAKFLKSQKPDIICLQETIRNLDKKVFRKYHSKSIIDKYLKKNFPYTFFGPQWISRGVTKPNGQFRNYGGDIEQGNYIMSKYPIVAADNEFYFKHYSRQIDHRNFYKEDHPRSIAIADIKIKNKIITILTLHGNFTKTKIDTERTIKQSLYIIKRIKNIKNPIILAGDLNVNLKTKSIKMIERKLQNMMSKYKIKSTSPKRKQIIDFIFINKKIKPLGLQVPETNISDHLPLIFDFEIK